MKARPSLSPRYDSWLLALSLILAFGGSVGGADAPEETVKAAGTATPVRVLVAYDSLSGNTTRMAEAAAGGARRLAGAEVVVRKVAEVTREDLERADGIVLGCPTYYGTMPGRMKAVIDDWSWKWKVDFTDKAGGAFATGGGTTGGKEFVVMSILMFMLNNRMVVAGPLYRNERTGSVWAEAGASAVTGPVDPGVGESELDAAGRLGERIVRLAARLKDGTTRSGKEP